MANDEHVALLKKGVAAWNAWREENPHISPDLTKANLSKANLSGASLVKANLRGSNLSRARLGAANLGRADLTAASPLGGDLREGDLHGCSLTLAAPALPEPRGADPH